MSTARSENYSYADVITESGFVGIARDGHYRILVTDYRSKNTRHAEAVLNREQAEEVFRKLAALLT